MATTTNLGVTKIEANQSQKEVTANEGFDIFDRAIAGELVHNFVSDANYTLVTVDGEHLYAILQFTDSGVVLTTGRDVIVPDSDKIWVVRNETAQTLTVKTSAGTGIAVAASTIVEVYCDGTNVEVVSEPGSTSFASSAEINTGTESAKANSPDALAGSNFGQRGFCVPAFGSGTDAATGDGTLGFVVPAAMAGMNVIDCVATVHTAGTTGTTDMQIRRRRAASDVDVLSTKLTIDSTETSSTTAATPFVVNTSNDDLAEGDVFYVDVDAVSTTAPKGLSITIMAQLP